MGFPAPLSGRLRYPGDERSFPASPCCRLPLWHWLLHRPRSIPHSLCQQQSCSKPSLIKETHSLYRHPGGGGGMLSRGTLEVSGDSQHPQRVTDTSQEQSPWLWAALLPTE